MRQIGTLQSERRARQFADYLVTQDIESHAEEDGGGWAIWVRDEEQIQQAIEEFEDYRENPDDPVYAGVQTQAEIKRREEAERRRAAAKNIVELRGNWNAGLTRRAPVTFLLIAVCVAVFIMTHMASTSMSSATYGALSFREPGESREVEDQTGFYSIQRGQVWRLVTPIFMHGDVLHIFFNMYMLYYFGGQFESRRNWLYYLLFVVLSGAVGNVAQVMITGPHVVGISGVVYGLFGYIWMQARFVPKSGFFIGQITVIILIVWFFAPLLPIPMFARHAMAAHGGGLLFGVIVGYLPVIFPKLAGKL